VGVLVISPTRELALQIHDEAKTLLTFAPALRVQAVIGGTNMNGEKGRMTAGGGRGTSFPGYRHPRTQGAALGEAPNLAPSALELKFILIHRVSECKEPNMRKCLTTLIRNDEKSYILWRCLRLRRQRKTEARIWLALSTLRSSTGSVLSRPSARPARCPSWEGPVHPHVIVGPYICNHNSQDCLDETENYACEFTDETETANRLPNCKIEKKTMNSRARARQEMHHFGPQISLRPVSAAIGGEYSPREGLASLSPRGMTPRGLFSAQSPRLMNLKNMSFVKQVAVDPQASTYAIWEKHVQLTNMRQSFAASRGFSRDGSATISRPASAQFGHLSPRMRTRKPGRVLDVPSGLPSGFGPLELWGTVPEGEFGQPLQRGSASPASPSTRKPPTTSAAPKLFALPQGISLEELQSAHDQIKEKLLSKYGSFTRAFRSIDQDGTGFIERHEFERALRTVNLDGIRQPVVLCLLEMMDYDDDDDGEAGYDIKYEEFVQFLAADDVRTLFAK
jgi:hypothetical protein